MSNVSESRKPLYARRPYLPIEVIIALVLIVGGAYIVSPFFIVNAASTSGAVSAAMSQEIVQRLLGPLYMLPGLLLGYGIIRDNKTCRKWGLFGAVIIITFIQVTGILSNGIRPLTWIYPLGMAAVSAVVWLRLRWEQRNGG